MIEYKKYLKILLVFLLSFVAISCTGGGGSGGSSTPETAPVVLDGKDGGVVAGDIPNSIMPMIVLKFSKAMNANTINGSTIKLQESDGTDVAITGITSTDNTRFYFSPSNLLKETAKYNVVLADGILSADGGKFVPFKLSFMTGDFTAPTVAIYSPENGESKVQLIPKISLRFSESVQNINSDTVVLREGSKDGTIVPLDDIISNANNSYEFYPKTKLKEYTTYYLQITDGVTDFAVIVNKLISRTFSFTTGEFTSPEVSLNTKVFNRNPQLNLHFNEEVKNIDVNSVQLINQSNNSQVNVSIFKNGVTDYLVRPEGLLEPGVDYKLTLTNSIADVSNNLLKLINFEFKVSEDWTYLTRDLISNELTARNPNIVKINFKPQDRTPYLSFQEIPDRNLPDGGARVMKFDGTNWIPLLNNGSEYVSESKALWPSLAFDKAGEVYLTYRDSSTESSGSGAKASVIKFDGNQWSYLGNKGVTQFTGNFSTLNFDDNNIPYLSFQDGSVFDPEGLAKANVMKFDGESWVYVGNRGISDGVVQQVTSAFNPVNKKLYIAYRDVVNSNGLTVMTYESNQWNVVGQKNISQESGLVVSNPSFVFDPISGDTHVKYSVPGASKIVSFNVSDQQINKITNNVNPYPSLIIAKDGTYYNYSHNGSVFQVNVSHNKGQSWDPLGKPILGYTSVADFNVDDAGLLYIAFYYNGNLVTLSF